MSQNEPIEEPKIEEVSSDEEEMPALEEVKSESVPHKAQSRAEKKTRKAMAKLGLQPYSGVKRVAIRKGKNALFVVNNPDVFKAPTSDTYVVFGEFGVEDLTPQAHAQAASQFSAPETAAAAPEKKAVIEDNEDADAGSIEEKDIELVMEQANVSRGKAISALKTADGDIVNAIMELTM
eukprot:GCRY01000130.1.p1 GENE.GCRY01000130.1~~GCRY01000130.1.p1  ORF type:complete len:179 (+),score=46.56 GCRY01000130.1:68-604(+)